MSPHVSGKCALCRLLGCDVYSFEFKINHIARHIRLPDAPVLGPGARGLPPEQRPPPLLVINIQLPMYPVRVLTGQAMGVRAERPSPECYCWHGSLSPAEGALTLAREQHSQLLWAVHTDQCKGAASWCLACWHTVEDLPAAY